MKKVSHYIQLNLWTKTEHGHFSTMYFLLLIVLQKFGNKLVLLIYLPP